MIVEMFLNHCKKYPLIHIRNLLPHNKLFQSLVMETLIMLPFLWVKNQMWLSKVPRPPARLHVSPGLWSVLKAHPGQTPPSSPRTWLWAGFSSCQAVGGRLSVPCHLGLSFGQFWTWQLIFLRNSEGEAIERARGWSQMVVASHHFLPFLSSEVNF